MASFPLTQKADVFVFGGEGGGGAEGGGIGGGGIGGDGVGGDDGDLNVSSNVSSMDSTTPSHTAFVAVGTALTDPQPEGYANTKSGFAHGYVFARSRRLHGRTATH
jgi:hypothetical protein